MLLMKAKRKNIGKKKKKDGSDQENKHFMEGNIQKFKIHNSQGFPSRMSSIYCDWLRPGLYACKNDSKKRLQAMT